MTRFPIPSEDTVADLRGVENVRPGTYEDYKMIIEVVNAADNSLAFEHVKMLAEERGFDGSDNTFKGRVKDLFDWKSELVDWIVGQHPTAVSWVDVGTSRAGVAEVTPDTMNDVKQGCTDEGKDLKDAYVEASLREFRVRAFGSDLDDLDLDGDPKEIVDVVMDEIGPICAKEFPKRIDSINQATSSIAGSANEEIFKRCLEYIGYTEGDEFTSEGDDSDLTVYSPSPGCVLNSEIKSEKSRERADRSLRETSHPWVLASFFNDQKEVVNGMFKENDQGTKWIKSSVAAYIPPSTLQNVKDHDDTTDVQDAYDYRTDSNLWGFSGKDAFDDLLFLRSNEEFAADMRHYRQHGTLQDLDPGHET